MKEQNLFNKLDELEMFKQVNACETLSELAKVIESFADDNGMIQGRKKKHDAKLMSIICKRFSPSEHNMLTREFGIRQQALYILFYQIK